MALAGEGPSQTGYRSGWGSPKVERRSGSDELHSGWLEDGRLGSGPQGPQGWCSVESRYSTSFCHLGCVNHESS